MEFPGAWNRLTASLNVARSAGSPDRIWAFLVDDGLLRNQPGDRATFLRVYADAAARHDAIRASGAIGGTPGLAIATAVRDAGLATADAALEDPFGERAEARFAEWQARSPG